MVEFKEKKYIIHLKNIKSSYIIKGIFSFLNERQKLNMIVYNKKFQKIFLVDLEDYMEISGKYIIVERTGEGKEYYIHNDELLFEGEYLNGKRNGKGKEYFGYDKLLFEGEYLNGKRNGKGKEYYKNGNLKFEGEFLNGEKNGKGKECLKTLLKIPLQLDKPLSFFYLIQLYLKLIYSYSLSIYYKFIKPYCRNPRCHLTNLRQSKGEL